MDVFNYENNQTLYYLWNTYQRLKIEQINISTDRNRENFYKLFEYMEGIYRTSNRWNGQSKSEFNKNFKRVSDIVEKSGGDEDKAIKLSQTQATRITDEWKAINRAMAAKEMGHEHIFEIFFQRAYDLGSVTKQDYREYKLAKLGI